MATYVYDAWGNCTITKNTNGLGTLNPFRYRGYYWDSNLGLYYLISRYYDPQTGRFINSDTLDYLDPETLGGLNLYAYCGNNPVMGVDPEGHSASGVIFQMFISLWSYIAFCIGSLFDKDIKQDMENIKWNPFNDDEKVASSAKKVSFYKGVPVVIRQQGGSVSFGMIGLDQSEKDRNEILKHERGHNTQLMAMGIAKYLFFVGIPSPIKNGDHTPWELSANILGNSNLGGNPTPQEVFVAQQYYKNAVSCNLMLWLINLYYMLTK